MISVDEAIQRLQAGEVVALPTETVYGLAALPSKSALLEKIKGRSDEKKFVVAISSLDMMNPFEPQIPDSFYPLAKKNWPGPLTLVLPTKGGTTAFRMPDHPLALAVIEQTGPLLLTSANVAGQPPATNAQEVALPVPILDGGPCRDKVASTILLFDGEWKLLRQGNCFPTY